MIKKKIAVLVPVLSLCLGLGVGAYAASNCETISALLNRSLKVVYNGVEQHMTDTKGDAVYPISYNDTTYLPVRALSAMLGVPIEFNAETYSVELGNANEGGETTTIFVPSATLSLNRADFSFSKAGETFKMKANGAVGVPVWSVGNTAVATISDDGTVTAVGSGTTIITCTVDGQILRCIVRCQF